MTITFDQLKTAVKNGIDKKVRDKLEGRVPPSPGPTARGLPDNSGIARSNTPQGLPVQRSDMPTIHSNNPFANALSGGPPDRDNSMLDHSGLGNVNYDQHRGNPSGGGPSHSQMSVGMNGQQGQPNSDLMHKISSLEHQLVQQRQLVDDLKKINDGQKDMIDRLKQDKSSLENELDREKRKAREMVHSGPADHKDEIQRLQQANMALESEILNLNKENAKLFEATQANLAKLSGNSDGGQSLRQKVAQLTAENGYLKDQLGSGSLKGGSSNLGAGTDQEVYQLKQKINKLEFENANLRDQSVLSANQEVAALQTEIRKLKTDALLEVKALKSKLIVAEEKANTLMNQYKDRISSGYSTEAQKPAAIFDSKKFLQELYSTNGSHHDRDTFTAHDYSNRLGGLVQPTYLTSGLVTALKEQDQAVLQGYIQPVGRSRSPIYDTHRYGTTTPSYTYPSGLPTSEHVVHYRLGKSPVAVPAGTSGVTSRPTSISRPSYDPSSGGVDMRASYVSTVSIPLNMGSLERIPHSVSNYNQGQTCSVSRGRPSTGMEGFSTQYSQRVAGVYNTTRAEDRSGRRVSRVDGTSPHQVRDSYVSIYGPQETRPHTSRSPSTLGPSQTFLAEFSRKIKDLQ